MKQHVTLILFFVHGMVWVVVIILLQIVAHGTLTEVTVRQLDVHLHQKYQTLVRVLTIQVTVQERMVLHVAVLLLVLE